MRGWASPIASLTKLSENINVESSVLTLALRVVSLALALRVGVLVTTPAITSDSLRFTDLHHVTVWTEFWIAEIVSNKLQAGGGHDMSRPSPPSVGVEAARAAEPTAAPADRNVAVDSLGEYFPTFTAAAAWCVNAAVSKAAWYSPFDLESGVRVTCDVCYLCANFSLPRPLCSRFRPDVRDRQMSDIIIAYYPRLLGAGHNNDH